MRIFKFSFFIFLLFAAQSVSAQTGNSGEKIKYKADKLTNSRKGKVRFKKLLGNVVFTQGTSTVYCDSSYFYTKENRMEGFGRVKIVDDSVTITSKKLIYEGDFGMARLREDVVYQKGEKFLYTDFLDYNTIFEVGEFSQDGKLVDEQNTLTSSYGVYYAQSGQAFFYNDVLLVSPDFNLTSDTLEYSTITKVAITKGPTYIEDKNGRTVDADGGTFRTASDQTTFEEGTIETRNYVITGDELFIDDLKEFYTAKGNVVMTSKKDDIVIFGKEAVYDKTSGVSKVYGEPLMRRTMEVDTFFMSADTLVSIEDVDKDKERILAYFDILIYKNNLQGKSDSAAYFLADSTIQMYNDPVLWNKTSQMVADTVDLFFKEDVLKTMKLRRSSFLISIDTLGQHNQIKGREMIGDFDPFGNIRTMDVVGNGESHYFLLKGDSLMIGMNKVVCSSMKMVFATNILKNITFYNQPEANFIPPHELEESDLFLEGFDWRDDERPSRSDVVGDYDQNIPVPAIAQQPVKTELLEEVPKQELQQKELPVLEKSIPRKKKIKKNKVGEHKKSKGLDQPTPD